MHRLVRMCGDGAERQNLLVMENNDERYFERLG